MRKTIGLKHLDAVLHFAQTIGEKREFAAGGDTRIELTQAARRRVTRIGKLLLTFIRLRQIQSLKIRALHQHLAAHLQHLGKLFALQAQGNRAYRAHIRGHILASLTIAARRGLHQNALLIAQIDRQPVKFHLTRIFDTLPLCQQTRATQFILHPLVKRAHLRIAKSIGQRQHRHAVTHFGKLRQRRTAHPLRRRISAGKLRMRLLQRLQFTKQRVVFGVTHRRRVIDVVGNVVRAQLLAQLRDLLFDSQRRLGQIGK